MVTLSGASHQHTKDSLLLLIQDFDEDGLYLAHIPSPFLVPGSHLAAWIPFICLRRFICIASAPEVPRFIHGHQLTAGSWHWPSLSVLCFLFVSDFLLL